LTCWTKVFLASTCALAMPKSFPKPCVQVCQADAMRCSSAPVAW
jgi:hypothetical protein